MTVLYKWQGKEGSHLHMCNFQNSKPLRPFKKAEELRHKVILVTSIDETLSTVVHKPTGNVCPEHCIRPVVFLQAPARKTVYLVRSHFKAWKLSATRKQDTPAPCYCSASTTVCLLPTYPCSPSHERSEPEAWW